MKADKIIGGILVAFSIFMYYQADKLPEGTFGTLGAGIFPKILFILLAVAGIVLAVNAVINAKKIRSTEPELKKKPSGTQFIETLRNYKNVILAFLVFFGYVVLMYYFGYPIATVIFMPVIMWILGPRNKKAAIVTIAVTIGVTFAIHISFLKFLKIFLPAGKLF